MVATHQLAPAGPRPVRILMVVCAALAVACVEAPPPPSGSDNPLADRLSCLGETPACLSACASDEVLSGAACTHGVWTCPAGIREDLCCDAVHDPDGCPVWGDRACSSSEPCAAGYTCVRSRAFPIPVDPDEVGLCRIGDWSLGPYDDCSHDALAWPDALLGGEVGPVQVRGVVGVEPLCDDQTCMPDNPCCQQCTGSYSLALVSSDGVAFSVSLRTETTACGGTNCGFSCAPLQPGRRYRIWGVWDPTEGGGSGTLFYAGHCDD
ncbi:MAG: hypothetical protein U1F43_27235 [Myxococcota bacterium]